jgi:branched-chain amino acid transport system substrate-binding protein
MYDLLDVFTRFRNPDVTVNGFEMEFSSWLMRGKKMINAKMLLRICKPAFFLWQMLLLLAFGCGPAPTPLVMIIDTSSPTPTIEASATQTSLPTSTATSIPTFTLTPFVPKAVIKIVIHGPLSGDKSDFGQDLMRGAQLAIQQLSGPLNELNYKVELATYDDQNIAEVAMANAQQLVADPQILCGIGHYDSAITIEASNIYHQAGLAFIVPSVTDRLLTDRSFLEINRLIGRVDGQGVAAAKFAKDQGFTRVYIVTPKSGTNVRNADSFRVESAKLGIKRVGTLLFNPPLNNIDLFISQIISTQPDLIYIANTARQAIPLLTKLRDAGYKGAFLGTERLDNQSLITSKGAALIKGGSLFYTIMSPPVEHYSGATKFIQDFQNQYGVAPGSLAARAYDATGICLKAIEGASKADGGELPTRAEVTRAVRAVKDYKGLTGTYNFNNHGDPNPEQYYVYQVVSTDAASWNQNPIVATYEITPP